MYLSFRAIILRNIAVTAINTIVTLGILLVAPLGLAGVVVNTIAVGISTFVVSMGLDLLTAWLRGGVIVKNLLKPTSISSGLRINNQQDAIKFQDKEYRE